MEKALRKYLPSGAFQNVSPRSSRNLSSVRGRNNKTTELRLRLALVRAGVRGWQLHAPIVGNPDFLFRDNRIAVFVDGCFWHGCPLCGHIPKNNALFWRAKIMRNAERDRRNTLRLRAHNFRVIRFWEHELTNDIDDCVARILSLFAKQGDFLA